MVQFCALEHEAEKALRGLTADELEAAHRYAVAYCRVCDLHWCPLSTRTRRWPLEFKVIVAEAAFGNPHVLFDQSDGQKIMAHAIKNTLDNAKTDHTLTGHGRKSDRHLNSRHRKETR